MPATKSEEDYRISRDGAIVGWRGYLGQGKTCQICEALAVIGRRAVTMTENVKTTKPHPNPGQPTP